MSVSLVRVDAVVALERCGGYATRPALLAAGAAKREISAAVTDRRIAAVLWGLEVAHQPGVHVTVARDRSPASLPGVDVHRADLAETEICGGLRVTTVLRTVLDCARTLPLADAVVVADSALRSGLVTVDELDSATASLTGRDTARVRRVVALADPQCGSVLESVAAVRRELAKAVPPSTQTAA
jgi:hypothetical protein